MRKEHVVDGCPLQLFDSLSDELAEGPQLTALLLRKFRPRDRTCRGQAKNEPLGTSWCLDTPTTVRAVKIHAVGCSVSVRMSASLCDKTDVAVHEFIRSHLDMFATNNGLKPEDQRAGSVPSRS